MSAPQRVRITTAAGRELVFDALLSADETHDAEASQHPVERGSDVGDHVRYRGYTLTLALLHTATPGSAAPDLSASEVAQETRHWRAWGELVALAQAGAVLEVETADAIHGSMVITSAVMSRDAATGHSVRPKVTLRYVRVVESRTVRVPVHPKVKAGAPQGQSADGQPTAVDGAAIRAQSRSFLKSLLAGGGDE